MIARFDDVRLLQLREVSTLGDTSGVIIQSGEGVVSQLGESMMGFPTFNIGLGDHWMMITADRYIVPGGQKGKRERKKKKKKDLGLG